MKIKNFVDAKGTKIGSMSVFKNRMTGRAVIRFDGEICGSSGSKYKTEDKCPADIIEVLNGIDDNEDIDIYINSPGGDAFGAISICNILKRHGGVKNVYIDGVAASAASIIAMSGDKITMLKGSMLMIHKPMVSLYGYHNTSELSKKIETLNALENSMIDIYEEHFADGMSSEKIRELIDIGVYLDINSAPAVFDIEISETSQTTGFFDKANDNAAYKAEASQSAEFFNITNDNVSKVEKTFDKEEFLIELELI